MTVRWTSLPLLALLPALAVAAPAPRAKPKKPVKKPAATEPAPSEPATDKPAEPEPTPPAGGVGSGGSGGGAGGGAGSAAPAPTGEPAARAAEPEPDKPAADAGDVDSLRQEYLSLRDELFKSRARANAVASQLYSTRVQIKLTYTTGRFYNPAKATIRLDGANVYEDATGAIGGDDGVRFDGYVAPGRHLVTFRVEATGKDDDSFTSTTEAQIVVKAVAGKNLIVAGKAHDAGDIAYEWKRSEHGSYGLGVDVSVQAVKPAAEPAGDAAGKAGKK
jgi:hypothetical protein